MERLAFHQRLRLERMKRGWSQDDLAGEACVEPKTVWRWEKGERIPRSQNLRQLCKALNMTPVELGLLDIRSLRPAKSSPPSSLFPSSSLLEQALDVVVGAQLEQEQTEAVPPRLWRSVPRVSSLPGRLEELVYLGKLLLTEHCHVVAVLGMGVLGRRRLRQGWPELCVVLLFLSSGVT